MQSVKDIRIGESIALSTGFQATQIERAADAIKRMKQAKAKVFLSFTSNMVATGLRGIIAELCERKYIDAIITAGGALDHDYIRCYDDYFLGEFLMDDKELHEKDINRLGNVLIPNDRYVKLEEKMKPVFDKLYNDGKMASPSDVARAIGEQIGKDKTAKAKGSFLYWCAKNKIPVYCPGITDSAIGLQVYFYKQKKPDFGIDVTDDMPALAQMVLDADKTGGIILGGGISKHHTIAVNLLRGGLDYAIYLTTASPWDGSLSGARTNEAISWGKLAEKADHVSVDGDATVMFPEIMKKVFGKK
jgi:deoxyhypusine synthase